jgi:hypothetical protein
VAVHVELAKRLDDGGVEAHGNPVGHLDGDPHLVIALPPPLAGAVQVPRAGHAHVGVQHQTVVPDDLEVLAVALDQLDDASQLGLGPVESRCVEPHDGLAHQRGPQRCGRSMNGIALRHCQNRKRSYPWRRAIPPMFAG